MFYNHSVINLILARTVSSAGRALARHARGHKFKSCTVHHSVSQLRSPPLLRARRASPASLSSQLQGELTADVPSVAEFPYFYGFSFIWAAAALRQTSETELIKIKWNASREAGRKKRTEINYFFMRVTIADSRI